MTTAKPRNDGYILNLNWDNANIMSQLYIPSDIKDKIGFRIRKVGGWTDWVYSASEKYTGDIKLVGMFGKDIQGANYFAPFNLPQGDTYNSVILKSMSIYGIGNVADLSVFTAQIENNNLRIYTQNSNYAGKAISVEVTLS